MAFHGSQNRRSSGHHKIKAPWDERQGACAGSSHQAEEAGRKLEGQGPEPGTGAAEAETGQSDQEDDVKHN